jgi:flagellar basal body L-ring protein FlgH
VNRAALGAAVIAAAFLAAGCGEAPQVTVYKQGKYQGKPDTQAWNNAPPAAELRGSAWNKGDRSSWETAINQRTMGQNEDNRIYKQ